MHHTKRSLYLAKTTQLFTQLWASLQTGEADGGGGGIRTHGRLSPTSVFKTGAFNHSATPPTTMEVLGFYDVIKRLSEKNLLL